MKNLFSKYLSVLLLIVSGNFAFAADKPNIIIIVADDLGYADLGVQGCKDFHTPHIDSIAKKRDQVHQRVCQRPIL